MKKKIFKMAVLLIACLFVFASCKDTVEAVQFTDEIASVNGEVYSSLQEAINNANAGGEVKLLCDVVGSGVQINESITLDFDGHTYTFKEGEVGYQEAKDYGGDGAIKIESDIEVILQNAVLIANKGFTKSLICSQGSLTIEDTKLSANEGYTKPLIDSVGSLKVNKTTIAPVEGCPTLDIKGGSVEFDAETVITGVINVGDSAVSVKFATTPTDVFFTGNVEDNIVVNGTTASDFKASVAKIGSTGYGTLQQAVTSATDGETITLLISTEGEGIFVGAGNRTFTIDLNGQKYTCTTQVGSPGTLTQGFHLEKGNTITIKNGTITTKNNEVEKIVIQNYCNLTLEDVTLDGTNLKNEAKNTYVLSNNCGKVLLKGKTNITAKNGGFAFDACGFQNYTEGVSVTVDTTGVIKGKVELTRSAGNEEKVEVTIKNGTFLNWENSNNLIKVNAKDAVLNITGGKFTDKWYCVSVYHDTKLNISGGEFNVSADGMVICGNGTADPSEPNYGSNTNINISGGTFNAGTPDDGYNTCCIYHPQSGTLTITGGTFNATDGVGILMRGGRLSVSSEAKFYTSGTSEGKIGDATQPSIQSGFDIVIDKQCGYYDSANIVADIPDSLNVKEYPEGK